LEHQVGHQARRNVIRSLQWAILAGAVAVTGGVVAQPAPAAETASAAVVSPNRIDGVALARSGAGRAVVRVQLGASPDAAPTAFMTSTPPRLSLDFPNTVNNAGAGMKQFDDALVKSAQIVQVAGRTRVVLALAKPQSYDIRVEDNAVLVTLSDGAVGGTSATQDALARFAEVSPSQGATTVSNVDFRRGPAGEGRLMLDLSSDHGGIDVRQQGRLLVVDLQNAQLPPTMTRRFDVADFGTPVASVVAANRGENAQIMIEPRGKWEFSAYQADKRFVVEVKPLIEDPNKLARKEGYKGDKLSLNFQNVDVRAVLQVIADFTGLNIVTSESVQGTLTLRLKDVPWDQALDIVMQTKNLDLRRTGNVVMVAPREELNTKEKAQLEAALQIGELEPLVTESFQLNYMKVQDFEKMLATNRQQAYGAGAGQTATTGGQGSILSKRGVAFIDPRTNTLFVSDTASRMEEVRKIIRQLDTAVRQVVIEARIVIAGDSFSRALGVRFGVQTAFTFNRGRYSVGQGGSLSSEPVVRTEGDRLIRETRTQTPFEAASGLASVGYSDSPQLNVNLPVANAAGQLAMTLINLGSGNLINLELTALEQDNRGKVVSSPRVVTADNQPASIEQGTEIPYVTPGSANQPPTVSFKKAVLRLEVTPQITPDNKIIMKVKVNKDSVGQYVQLGGGFAVPSIDTKNVETMIAVSNGDTAVIGGIYEEINRNDVDKVPFLGDLPVMGYLFKTTTKSTDKTELLIFLTPRVVRDVVAQTR
jgi:type IV pilus assembly protein PilQ